MLVGGFSYCGRRDWPILAAFSAGKGGVQFEERKTGLPWPFTRRAHASATHWAVVTICPGLCVGSVHKLRDAVGLPRMAAMPPVSSGAPSSTNRARVPKLAALMDGAEADGLAYRTFPRTTNPLERSTARSSGVP